MALQTKEAPMNCDWCDKPFTGASVKHDGGKWHTACLALYLKHHKPDEFLCPAGNDHVHKKNPFVPGGDTKL